LAPLAKGASDTAAIVAGAQPIDKDLIRPGPALLLALGFGAPPTSYNALTPSVSIGIRPSVLKNGDAVRLQLNFQVKIDAVMARADEHPYNMVKNQTVTSDVAITALDLFQMSSTNLQVTGR